MAHKTGKREMEAFASGLPVPMWPMSVVGDSSCHLVAACEMSLWISAQFFVDRCPGHKTHYYIAGRQQRLVGHEDHVGVFPG